MTTSNNEQIATSLAKMADAVAQMATAFTRHMDGQAPSVPVRLIAEAPAAPAPVHASVTKAPRKTRKPQEAAAKPQEAPVLARKPSAWGLATLARIKATVAVNCVFVYQGKAGMSHWKITEITAHGCMAVKVG